MRQVEQRLQQRLQNNDRRSEQEKSYKAYEEQNHRRTALMK